MYTFTEEELQQVRSRGMNEGQVLQQVEAFKSGFPPARLVAPATVGKGMLQPDGAGLDRWISLFEQEAARLDITRFVPASGAATRMFKALFSALDSLKGLAPEKQWTELKRMAEVNEFVNRIKEYPFAEALKLKGSETPSDILEGILAPDGLNYGSLPKGMLLFHSYPLGSRTPLEEHLREAAAYCTGEQKTMNFHLTVSPDHLEGFQELASRLVPVIEKEQHSKAKISFSTQKEQTDTIAVDLNNQPVKENGNLVFRPGGHGALLENLNDLDSELVFISNIDNVSPDRNKDLRIRYKKVLGGILLEVRNEVYRFLEALSTSANDMQLLTEAGTFVEKWFYTRLPQDMEAGELKAWLKDYLDRPLRVCGMVRNQGEPGGGPFFIEDKNGKHSLQIVESSQVDLDDPGQRDIFSRSTHFNPVDLACSLRDFNGKAYDLLKYRDPDTGFIAKKSLGGLEIKALELPGLWNGSMAHWLTIFVEVPVESFTPVKTVFDLLRPEHR